MHMSEGMLSHVAPNIFLNRIEYVYLSGAHNKKESRFICLALYTEEVNL